ncbi:dephospho-CoA kinase [Roseibium denhamense]|uniref:Dephospho-CoA kinase n=1 Tax=Roseibium denhamense TaxID=76305 RepID=A0ABY1PB62_9HYPH|nr:dephospho-CoA kinase [Roseibium denhamense]MTI05265.1 dephospho-CoA kinase [Roseibium denhamense]SMP30587.1 dephospho-CoA kinase [Roseibium denhamense]
MIKLGLTGSIGMGKSTTAGMFANLGVPVHDADKTVHTLYSGRAAPLIEAAFPGTVENGQVDRKKLSAHVLGNAIAMKRLEDIVHPLVQEEEQAFLKKAASDRQRIVVLDIPLLFETGGENRADVVVVVTADASIQRERVLSRPGMTEDRFNAILAKQMPDIEKRKGAHFLIDTGLGMEPARRSVKAILKALAPGG